MPCISIGNCYKKIIFPLISIFLSYIIYILEYFSGYFSDYRKYKSPNLFSFFFSFSFCGSLLFGGIFYGILEKNSRNNSIEKLKVNENASKAEKGKTKIRFSLLYEDSKRINVPLKYLFLSALLELIQIFSFRSIVFDFMDIESKIVYAGFEIIFIKLISKCIFKYKLYRHQIISMIILLLVLFSAIMFRETFLMKIVKNEYTFYENDYEDYIKDMSNAKLKAGIIYYYYLGFLILGLVAKSIVVCFDKWLITDILCDPNKLLFFKGLFGFIPALATQLVLFYILGETRNINEESINIINVYKRLSLPISSFTLDNKINKINIAIIIGFFLIVGLYYSIYMKTISEFSAEYIGCVSIISSTISIITIQFINAIIHGNGDEKRILRLCLVHFLFFIFILIPTLIICEIIILHFCKCDKNISSSIEKRAKSEVISSLRIYDEEEEDTSVIETDKTSSQF